MKTKNASTREVPGALPFVPESRSLAVLREAAQHCKGCDIYRHVTQAVFGEIEGSDSESGVLKTRMMLIGEQPGDREDREGHPFVGPAGKLLDQCLEEAGIDRKGVYVTNAVKHFKSEPRGKLRIHKKPLSSEIFACRPWLDAELETVRPALIVCLGAVAAQSLLGSRFKVTESQGTIQQVGNLPSILATFHPASILRALKDEERRRQTAVLISDLKNAEKFRREQKRAQLKTPKLPSRSSDGWGLIDLIDCVRSFYAAVGKFVGSGSSSDRVALSGRAIVMTCSGTSCVKLVNRRILLRRG